MAQKAALLTGFEVMLMLQVQGPDLENYWDKQMMPKAGELKCWDV